MRAGVPLTYFPNQNHKPLPTVQESGPLTAFFSCTQRLRVFRQRVRCALLQRLKDCVPNAFGFWAQAGVPKPQFQDAVGFQKGRALGIVCLLGGLAVPRPVQLDGKSGLRAEEIQFVFAHRMPAAKFVAIEAAVPQPAPHDFFGPSGGSAHRLWAFASSHNGSLPDQAGKRKIRSYARPHPGPLPRGEGGHCRSLRTFERCGCSRRFSAGFKARQKSEAAILQPVAGERANLHNLLLVAFILHPYFIQRRVALH